MKIFSFRPYNSGYENKNWMEKMMKKMMMKKMMNNMDMDMEHDSNRYIQVCLLFKIETTNIL